MQRSRLTLGTAQMEIVILRHGDAGKRIPVTANDHERSLTAAGRKEVEEVARSLRRLNLKLDKIATSPLKRSRETAEIVAEILNKGEALEQWDELKPEADRMGAYKRLAKLKSDLTVLLVGHEPYLSEMISEIISSDSQSRISLKKAGMAKLEVDSLSPAAHGELRWLLTPRQIKKLS